MNRNFRPKNFRLMVVALGLAVGMASQLFCAREQPRAQPDVPVRSAAAASYTHDIQPIFNEYCITCHGPRVAENGLRLDSYSATMKGTRFGAVVTPGKPSFSTLVFVLDGKASKEIAMPHDGGRLSPNRVENIKQWVDAGAPNN